MEGGTGTSACKQGKKKTAVSTGVFNGGGIGGIGGVVILGGALAAAAVIAIFANKRNKGRPRKKDRSTVSESSRKLNLKDKSHTDEEGEGLQLLVQPSHPSVHLNSCCKSNGTSEMGSTQMGADEFISTQNSLLEEISVLEINGGKETLINGDHDESFVCDVTNPESISLCKENGVDNEECTLPVFEISSIVLEEEVNKINDAREESPLLEVMEKVVKEEEASETVLVEQLKENVKKINDAGEESSLLEANEEAKKEEKAYETVLVEVLEEDVNKSSDARQEPPLVEAIEEAKTEDRAFERVIAEHIEENSNMKSVEEEEDDDHDHDEESEEEKTEDSSTETGDSSMESNAEAIWPTEFIEKLSLALKEMNCNHQISGEKTGEEDRTVKIDSSSKDDNLDDDFDNEGKITRNSMVISENKESIKLHTVNDQPVKSGKLRMLILPILGMVLLLLMLGLLAHHEALFSYLVTGDSVLQFHKS